MYKSPIEAIYGQLQKKFEGDVLRAVQSYDINVDKDELIKALEYDRGQYEAGYMDAMATIVHCKDCQYSETVTDPIAGIEFRVCQWYPYTHRVKDTHYCGYGIRKGDNDV